MPDSLFELPELATLYDLVNPPGSDHQFYLSLADGETPLRVLDVGSGTGMLAVSFAARGHDVTGVEPATGMRGVAVARSGGDTVNWVEETANGFRFDERFDLIVMTGHVFQIFLEDSEIAAVLTNLRDHLADGGRLAFETRNPALREWEQWVPERSREVVEAPGVGSVEIWNQLIASSQRFVAFMTCFRFPDGARRDAPSTLRLMDQLELAEFLSEAGFIDVEWYGNWDRSPLRDDSPELIVVARKATSRI